MTHLPWSSRGLLPLYRVQPKPDDAHQVETAPPPANWEWIGYIRPADGRWYAVAKAATLERCWDALLTTHMRGDMLAVPVVRPEGFLSVEELTLLDTALQTEIKHAESGATETGTSE